MGFAFDVRAGRAGGRRHVGTATSKPPHARPVDRGAGTDGSPFRETERGFVTAEFRKTEIRRGANIPVIVALHRNEMIWKVFVHLMLSAEPRRVHFEGKRGTGRRPDSCGVARGQTRQAHVPPMLEGESVHINMRILLRRRFYAAASLFEFGREAVREVAKFEGHTSNHRTIATGDSSPSEIRRAGTLMCR